LTIVMSMIAMNIAITKTTLTEILGFKRLANTTVANSTAHQPIPLHNYRVRRSTPLALTATLVVVVSAFGVPDGSAAKTAAASSLCGPVTPTPHPRSVHRLRIGVDPGLAGNPVPSSEPAKPIKARKELRALRGLRPHHRALVVRLNRLFWSGGARLLAKFRREARHFARHGFDVEVQVRYHPTAAESGDIRAWTKWVRHVTTVLSRIHRLVALTITNEVNFTVSKNTSDGSYPNAKAALVRGIEAASRVLHAHGRAHRVKLGFTYAYRFNPQTDANLFSYLKSHGGMRFRHALGFVGLDDYPGTVYPPVLAPGTSAGHELASALATMRTCYLPLGGIPRSVPLWVTENGYGSNAPAHSDAQQVRALRSMVGATRRYAGSYHVTDYRWFNLRDNASNGSGMFDQDGLLRDNYTRKPSYGALRTFIKHHGR